MEKVLDDYLDKIDRCLKPMTASERADIVREIRSEMTELSERDSLSPDQIVARLGSPNALARAYLGESLSKTDAFSWRKLVTLSAFYTLAGFSGMFVLPFTSVMAVGFMFCGIIAPLAVLIKLIGYLFGYNVPFVVFQFGNFTPHPVPSFVLSIVMGILLFMAGKGLWKLTLKIVRMIGQKKSDLTG